MFSTDLSKIRENRQQETNRKLAEILCHTPQFDDKTLKPYLNFKALDRLCVLLELTREEVYTKCHGDYEFALILAHGCAILSSRQGSKDEAYVLNKINEHTSKVGTIIKSLNNQDLRATRDGRVLTREQFKASGLSKLDCLKSFDGEMTGDVNGYIFAKIVFGGGGHQDNVIIEASDFAEWALKYGDPNKVYVLLIDTDQDKQYNELKTKYDSNNIWVVDHVEFQQRLGV